MANQGALWAQPSQIFRRRCGALLTEFFQQGEDALQFGLQVGPLMSRESCTAGAMAAVRKTFTFHWIFGRL